MIQFIYIMIIVVFYQFIPFILYLYEMLQFPYLNTLYRVEQTYKNFTVDKIFHDVFFTDLS